jgi:hypothetical protein
MKTVLQCLACQLKINQLSVIEQSMIDLASCCFIVPAKKRMIKIKALFYVFYLFCFQTVQYMKPVLQCLACQLKINQVSVVSVIEQSMIGQASCCFSNSKDKID